MKRICRYTFPLGSRAIAITILVIACGGGSSNPTTAFAASIPEDALPEWVVTAERTCSMCKYELQRNLNELATLNSNKKRPTSIRADFLMYGDSITYWNKPGNLTHARGTRAVWTKNFGDLVRALPLGIPGDRIANLAWRLTLGKERPTLDPKVIVIFIGINDVVHKTPDIPQRMDYLLCLFSLQFPTSKLIVQALLPSLSGAVQVNTEFERLAQKRGLLFSSCGQDIGRHDARYKADLIHPSAKGQDRLQACLRSQYIQPLLQSV